MKHIREFDGLRGLLALWVFATHVIELGPYPAAARYVHANLAVDIFIILSGFVIFHLLSTGEDYRTFITRRWFRLFPVFAVCFLAALSLYAWLGVNDEVAFGVAHTKKLMPYLATHATMLHGAIPDQILPHSARAILVPAWSISLEWQFYLLAPLLFAFAMRPNWKLALVVLTVIAVRVLHDAGPGALRSALQFDMSAFLPLRLEFFAVGIGSFGVWRWLSERQRPLEVPSLCYALLVPVVILVGRRSPAITLWLCGLLVLINIHFGSAGWIARRVSRMLNCSPAQFLGRISYCVYLLHLPALIFARQIIRVNQPGMSEPGFQVALLAGGLATTIAAAWLLRVSVERPLILFGKHLTKSWKTQVPTPGALRPA
jgi:peptidoglycan/LPS O-acetylase OafA/YrhL